MLNKRSVAAVDGSTFGRKFVKPLYGSYCFSRIPDTIRLLLTGQADHPLPADTIPPDLRSKKVLFLFIDSFGWKFWNEHHQKYPFLKRFLDKGIVSKLTSQFPSTTSAHVTTIHTGLPVGESGLFEWYYYEPRLDTVIAPLLFSFAGDKERENLRSTGIDPKEIYPKQTFYNTLKKAGVSSYVFQYAGYTPSPFSDTVFDGATGVMPYRSLAHSLTLLTQTIKETKGPSYYFYYYDYIDGAGHNEGPGSPTHLAEIHNLFTELEELLYNGIKKEKGLTILLSADHGMADTDPVTTYYLNSKLPRITSCMRQNSQGQLLAPAGSARDMFLYIKEKDVPGTVSHLRQELNGKAEVHEVEKLMSAGFFGPQISTDFKNRVGNVVILPYNHETVWWYEEDKFAMRYYGHHGGLTREEMEIPFLSISL